LEFSPKYQTDSVVILLDYQKKYVKIYLINQNSMFQSDSKQMTIDFDRSSTAHRKTRVDAIRGVGKAIFHPESSDFEASRFALKFSFR
jgi:hypothetical protein